MLELSGQNRDCATQLLHHRSITQITDCLQISSSGIDKVKKNPRPWPCEIVNIHTTAGYLRSQHTGHLSDSDVLNN